MKTFGHFDDASRAYCITEPVTPRPWINYIGNGRLAAFISQNAGGLLWLHEPYTRRLTRYHFIPAPGDRPGFYLYVRNRNTQSVWNPHFAPTCTRLDRFECRHSPGLSVFIGEKENVRIEVSYGIPPNDDVMLWRVKATNLGALPVQIELASYMEFGLLEFMRETLGWCYLKNHFGLTFDAATRSIRYDYHVFEAPACPAMAFACTDEVSRFECSRDAFVGRTGSLERPDSLTPGNDLSNSEIPGGGHACATLGIDLDLAPGEAREFGYCFAVADSWPLADALLEKYSRIEAIHSGLAEISSHWNSRFRALQVQTGVSALDRFVNVWNPCNAVVALENCRIISTDHTGVDGLRYRDTSQDALAVTHLDPAMAISRLRLVLAQQTKDGGGCFAFYPETARPTSDAPHRSDNTVWPVYTFWHLIAETGDASVLEEVIPFRDGGEASVYEHLKLGLEHIYQRRGPNGLPTMFHADWNDGLALFGDEAAESVMLGMQLVAACRDFRDLALMAGRTNDAAWCEQVADELGAILNSEKSWDGQWYRRLLLSNGKAVGTAASAQGQIYLDVQPWAVLSGVGDFKGRGALALESLNERLNTEFGLSIVAPPYRGFPEPGDKPLGSNPGTNENGGIFCHANTWAIIAECLLGNSERAFEYYLKLLPEEVINKVGAAHYEREPYAYVSTLLGPCCDAQGRAGISWLTGTASWMYVAVTQYILGIRPTLEGLLIRPCLPKAISEVRVTRQWRGVEYVIDIHHSGSGKNEVRIDGEILPDSLIKLGRSGRVLVQCFC
jgi:cellobiose phosphorylase